MAPDKPSPLIPTLDRALGTPPWNNLDLPREPRENLVLLLEELNRWNQTFSFTSLTHPRDLVEVFVLDSLAPLALGIPLASPLLDAGCGVGFPSLPLKIAQPHLEVVAVDSSRKKMNFVRHAIRLLKLKGYTPRRDRLENLAREGVVFPTVTVRALTGGEKNQKLVASLVSPGGRVIFYVGREWQHSLLPRSLNLEKHLFYTLPLSGKVRGLVTATRVV